MPIFGMLEEVACLALTWDWSLVNEWGSPSLVPSFNCQT